MGQPEDEITCGSQRGLQPPPLKSECISGVRPDKEFLYNLTI